MEVLKMSEAREDRLSELPDSLILLILSFLPIINVVKTTLLSKRWKDLWTTIPSLNFDDEEIEWKTVSSSDSDDDGIEWGSVRFRDFVNRALIVWEGTKILKFNVAFHFETCMSNHLDLWLRLAIRNEVEELYIDLVNVKSPCSPREYRLPQRLYPCSSIRKLCLVSCYLEIHGNVHWDQLRSLRIEGAYLSEHVANQILSGSPQLEVLTLLLFESYENLNIQSSSLKTLRIDKYVLFSYADDSDRAIRTVLTICAPNIETLEISGAPYSKCFLTNISSLTNATLSFDGDESSSGYELHGEMLTQLYQRICHVEKVKLSDWCTKGGEHMYASSV